MAKQKRNKNLKPKEPTTFKYPRMYYQPANIRNWYDSRYHDRIRILYPNGKTIWTYTVAIGGWYIPCWALNYEFLNGFEALEAMKNYDKIRKFPKAIFLGEIK